MGYGGAEEVKGSKVDLFSNIPDDFNDISTPAPLSLDKYNNAAPSAL